MYKRGASDKRLKTTDYCSCRHTFCFVSLLASLDVMQRSLGWAWERGLDEDLQVVLLDLVA